MKQLESEATPTDADVEAVARVFMVKLEEFLVNGSWSDECRAPDFDMDFCRDAALAALAALRAGRAGA